MLYASKETLDKLEKANTEIEKLEKELEEFRKLAGELADLKELKKELSAARRVIQIQAKHHDDKFVHQIIKTNIIRQTIGLKPKGKSEIQFRQQCNKASPGDGDQSSGAVSLGGDHKNSHPAV